MLINLSNHSSVKWTEKQYNTAIEQYGSVHDIAFPNIPPAADSKEINELVAHYLNQIEELQPKVVHLMGEMVFTYRLVSQLKDKKIPVVASSTNRIVEEKDGKKIVQFSFVQFREY